MLGQIHWQPKERSVTAGKTKGDPRGWAGICWAWQGDPQPPKNLLPPGHGPGQGQQEGSGWGNVARDSGDTCVGRTTYCVRIQGEKTPIRVIAGKQS